MLTIRGEISFWEVYDFDSMEEYLIKTDSLFKNTSQHILQNELQPEHEIHFALIPIRQYGAKEEDRNFFSIGYADVKDTAMVMSCLKYASDFFPFNCRFMWTLNPYNNNEESVFYELICLKGDRDGPSITGGIKSAESASSGTGAEINIKMDDETSRNWKKMTAWNIDKAIAIVVDNKVMSFPVVYQTIENGNSTITGNFTEEEARVYASVFNCPSLPFDVVLTIQ